MEPFKLLTAEEILAADDTQARVVEVPEWGGSVRLRGLSAGERLQLAKAVSEDEKDPIPEGFALRVVGMSLCNDKGERLFTDETLLKLKAKNGAVIERLFKEAQRISGLADAEETAKKSEAAPTSSSSSV